MKFKLLKSGKILNLNFKTMSHGLTDSKCHLFQYSTLCKSLQFKANRTFVLFGKSFQLNFNFMIYIGTVSYYKSAMLSHKVSWWLGYCLHRLSYSPFSYHLVQFVIFWTPFTLIFAKWQHLKHGHFDSFQVQQLSYIVLDRYKFKFSAFKNICIHLY
jgi:hypothetical protein